MKIEIGPSGVVKIDTDAAQAIAGIFPVHVEQIGNNEYGDADHTALEIQEAVNSSLVPVLFLHTNLEDVVCSLSRTVSHGNGIEAYEFGGFSSWAGAYCIAIDRDGKAFLPK